MNAPLQQVPQTSREITPMLRQLGLEPPDSAGYLAISKVEGGRFAEAVAKAVNAGPDAASAKAYVADVVYAVSEHVREAVQAVGAGGFPLAALIELGRREGQAFRNAADMIASSDDQNEVSAAAAYLRNMIEEYTGEALPAVALEDRQPVERRSTTPAPAEAAPAATRPANRDSAGPAPAPRNTPLPAVEDKPAKEYGESVHVYGSSCALCFCECKTPANDKSTVMVEGALSDEGAYRWRDKISIMLSLSELPLVLGVFRGKLAAIELKGHGRHHEKALSIENQGRQFFVKVMAQGAKVRAVPVPAADAYQVVAMLANQMVKNHPFFDVRTVFELTDHVCSMHMQDAKRRESDA